MLRRINEEEYDDDGEGNDEEDHDVGDDDDETDNAEDEVEGDDVEKKGGDDVEEDSVEEDSVEEEDDKDDTVAEDHDVAEDEVEDDDAKGEEDYDFDVEEDDVEAENGSQDRGPHFVRACAVEMHANISHEPLFRKFAGKMPRTRLSTERGHTLWGSLRGRNACQDFTRATSYGNLLEKCCRPDWAQNADTHFVRACAVEMHVKFHKSHFFSEIYRKNAAAQIEPRTQTHTLRQPAQSKRMPRFHKSHLIRNFTGKMPQPRLSPERGHTFCASLRSRNACQDLPQPRVSTLIKHRPLHLQYRANPSVWTHCLWNHNRFRSQTSDNMDRWKAEVGRVREEKSRREKIREEKEREERRCRGAKR